MQIPNDDNEQSAHDMRDSTTPTHPKGRTAETLIVSFCKREATTPTDFEETEYVRFNTKKETPNKELLQDIGEAVSEMTKDGTPEEADKQRYILTRHSETFVTKEESLGLCPHAEHSIDLRDHILVVFRAYKCSPADRKFIRNQVDDYIQKRIIQPSESEYAAPTIVVDQPHHPTTPRRMVHDYRKLNAKSVNPSYPMPIMQDVIDNIMRDQSKYFNIMNVKTAFLTVRVKQDDIHKTAFVTRDGKYEYL